MGLPVSILGGSVGLPTVNLRWSMGSFELIEYVSDHML